MRLLQRDDEGNYSLTPDLTPGQIPPYAILSHTWGTDEVIFTDLVNRSDNLQQKAGYEKIRFCAEQARRDGLRHFWVDTCCIDKPNSTELQTAINSMFRWYHNAKRCYVYLSDVSSPMPVNAQDGWAPWKTAFQNSRWFTRGWTLQELIAPETVEFYSREGTWLGDKTSLEPQLRKATGIPARALRGDPLSNFTIEERQAWASHRETTIEEDMAYSLLGILGVYMPMIYGEGRQNAQSRLREECKKDVKRGQYEDPKKVARCYKCHEWGHYANQDHCDDCNDEYGHTADDVHCFDCGKYGHIAKQHCSYCKKYGGHWYGACRPR
ncbi:heterokaryon incompatibility protein-domain-containing protein [Astrocystis sublimbata]|nr:heterokaryon incompatibility protein-domain-containing protein [Astrocystis sublimbata]